MKPRPSAVIVQNETGEGLGLLEGALQSAGFALLPRFREVASSDVDASLVVVLGGPMGVYEEKAYPFLNSERNLLESRLARGRPNLGICLGAQLLASAAGARVYPGQNGFELGALPVELTDAALGDPLFSGMGRVALAAHWHGDTYEGLPAFELLASSPMYPQQAFRFQTSFGFQFHPELDAAGFRQWLIRAPDVVNKSGRSLGELLANVSQLDSFEPLWREVLKRLVRRFAGLPPSPSNDEHHPNERVQMS